MNPESGQPFDPEQGDRHRDNRQVAITKVKERYLEEAKSQEDFSAAVPEPYPGARSQTRIRAREIRRLAESAEEIFTFEETLAGKAPEEIQAEIVRLQERIDQLVTDQREVQAKARKHDAIRTDSGQSVDPEVIARLDQEELAILRQSNLLSELKLIANDRLKG